MQQKLFPILFGFSWRSLVSAPQPQLSSCHSVLSNNVTPHTTTHHIAPTNVTSVAFNTMLMSSTNTYNCPVSGGTSALLTFSYMFITTIHLCPSSLVPSCPVLSAFFRFKEIYLLTSCCPLKHDNRILLKNQWINFHLHIYMSWLRLYLHAQQDDDEDPEWMCCCSIWARISWKLHEPVTPSGTWPWSDAQAVQLWLVRDSLGGDWSKNPLKALPGLKEPDSTMVVAVIGNILLLLFVLDSAVDAQVGHIKYSCCYSQQSDHQKCHLVVFSLF